MEDCISLKDISKSFREVQVFNQLSVSFPRGETTCFLGPSGCGKTTLLRIIAGTLKPDAGKLLGLEDQTFSFVFQEDRLLPWKTAAENIRLVLKHKIADKSIEEVIDQKLDLVKMKEYANYYPHQLSGGMRQRISFARAFGFPSDMILLDEPFKGLDLLLKQKLMENVRSILSRDHRTVIYVTHEPEEAAFFGKKILLMSDKPVRIIGEFNQEMEDHSNRLSFEDLVGKIKEKLNSNI